MEGASGEFFRKVFDISLKSALAFLASGERGLSDNGAFHAPRFFSDLADGEEACRSRQWCQGKGERRPYLS